MGIIKTKEKVRDGYLGDLPQDLQTKVMNIHKLIKTTVKDILDDPNYSDLKESRWAMSCIDDFCVMPKDKSDVGSVRIYKSGKTNRCMIQATGHFRNHQYGWIEELLHDFICNVYATIRPKIRRQYDMTITNEGRSGNPYEGFDIYPNAKIAKELWDQFEDKKTKIITEDGIEIDLSDGSFMFERRHQVNMSDDLKDFYEFYSNMGYENFFYERSHGKLSKSFRVVKDASTGHTIKIVFDLDTSDIKNVGHNINTINPKLEEIKSTIKSDGHNTFTSTGTVLAIIDVDDGNKRLNTVTATGPIFGGDDRTYTVGEKEIVPTFKSTSGKTIGGEGDQHYYDKSKENVQSGIDSIGSTFIPGYGKIKKARHLETSGAPTKEYRNMQKKIKEREEAKINKWKSCNHEWVLIPDTHFVKNMSKCSKCGLYKRSDGKLTTDAGGRVPYLENSKLNLMSEATNTPEYNVDMSETEAKKTLRTLSQTIINDIEKKKDYKMSQYTANIYANIITKNLLPIWAKGYRKFSITLDSYQSFFTFEFKVPTMTQDFVARFISGRESINGFLHRTPEIKIKMSPRIFHTMKNPDDAYNFFKAAIKYYDSSLEKACSKLMIETMKLNHEMKHLISTTKMSGIVIYPLSLLFKFEDVQMTNKDTFKISQSDINTVNRFIKGIYTKYAAPEKEKKQIVDDIKEVVKALREYSSDDENVKQLIYFPEAVEKYLFEGYTKEIEKGNELWIRESIDTEWLTNQKDHNVSYLQEKFGVKKLKKIPTDLVAYIQIETESIKDANDKMMISSYCLGKIEIVEWYIELLEVGSKKYIVPHTKPYLENIRTQLLACFKKIMDTPIPKKDRPLIDIQYPKGYEG